MTLTSDVEKRARYWASSNDFDVETRFQVQQLFTNKEYQELTDSFYKDLEFGTGGMRGIMGPGTCRINHYNIKKATFALCLYLQEIHSEKIKVALSYDSRINSREFALTAAEVLMSNGVDVVLTKQLRPVPLLSFLVREHKAQAGICITASHNPPEYNGFKVYWQDGGQLVPPHDQNIIKKFQSITNYSDFSTNRKTSRGSLKWVDTELDDAYLQALSKLLPKAMNPEKLKIVYTPLHGAGVTMVPKALAHFGFHDVHMPESQKEPDGSFPTVSAPNPEDQAALDCASQLAEDLNADVIMGTDPDCDRIGIRVREGDQFISITGNQLAVLLSDFLLKDRRQRQLNTPNDMLIKTIVTTEMLRSLSQYYGVQCFETLTGFKWIAEAIEQRPENEFICGGEESYGFLAGGFVRDKDACMACVITCMFLSALKEEGLTISEKMDELYLQHGYHYEILETKTLTGQQGAIQIQSMMESFRSEPLESLGGIRVLEHLDYQGAGTGLPSTNMLKWTLDQNISLMIRPSGTEPKIKVYITGKEGPGFSKDMLHSVKRKTQNRIEQVRDAFLEHMEKNTR